jgi:hypothetical protein
MGLGELGRVLTSAERAGWEARLQSLVGERITGVRYMEIDNRDPERFSSEEDPNRGPSWAADGFHGLDFGLELDFASGLQWWFTWQLPGGEGESLLAGSGRALTQEIQGGRVWDVADVAPWSAVAEVPIANTQILWDHWPAGAMTSSRELWCQTAYLLAFEEGTEIVIALGDQDFPSGSFRGSADNLAVFPSRDAAASCGFSFPPAADPGVV